MRVANTRKGRRVLPLPQPAVDALRAHRVDQVRHALTIGSAWDDEDFVFPSAIGTRWNLANFCRTDMKTTSSFAVHTPGRSLTARTIRATSVLRARRPLARIRPSRAAWSSRFAMERKSKVRTFGLSWPVRVTSFVL